MSHGKAGATSANTSDRAALKGRRSRFLGRRATATDRPATATGRRDTGCRDTLADAPVGQRVTVAAPGLAPAHTRRLAELGLRPGVEVVVLHGTAGGGRVIAVDDSRIALDRPTLRAIPVRKAARTDGKPAGPNRD